MFLTQGHVTVMRTPISSIGSCDLYIRGYYTVPPLNVFGIDILNAQFGYNLSFHSVLAFIIITAVDPQPTPNKSRKKTQSNGV